MIFASKSHKKENASFCPFMALSLVSLGISVSHPGWQDDATSSCLTSFEIIALLINLIF